MTNKLHAMPYQNGIAPEPKPKRQDNETQDGPQLPIPPTEPK